MAPFWPAPIPSPPRFMALSFVTLEVGLQFLPRDWGRGLLVASGD